MRNITFFAFLFVFILTIAGFFGCYDVLTYTLEVIPVFVGILVLFYFYHKQINIPNYLIIIIFIHMLILIIGGYYSYARVPLFDYLKIVFNWSRNNYDKVGHFMQGVTPFLITKEFLKRNHSIKSNFTLNFLSISVALAFSALYELFEFFSTIILGSEADDFLGMQGDIWDTQKDMLFALIGALTSCIIQKIGQNQRFKCQAE